MQNMFHRFRMSALGDSGPLVEAPCAAEAQGRIIFYCKSNYSAPSLYAPRVIADFPNTLNLGGVALI